MIADLKTGYSPVVSYKVSLNLFVLVALLLLKIIDGVRDILIFINVLNCFVVIKRVEKRVTTQTQLLNN